MVPSAAAAPAPPADRAVARALRSAVVAATKAPSVHNTQPWRFVVGGDAVEISADPTRRLRTLDPRGRQLTVSLGCALFNARVALAAGGLGCTVARFPEPGDPELVARLRVGGDGAVETELKNLAGAIEERRTSRSPFPAGLLPAELLATVIEAGTGEGAEVAVIDGAEDRRAALALAAEAESIEGTEPAYRGELRAWAGDEPLLEEGVPADAARAGGASATATLLVLGAPVDTPMSWLRTGEALERVLLELADWGYSAAPLTPVLEIEQTYARLRAQLRLQMYPHVLLRIGRAVPTPPTRRRRLVDVLTEA